MPTTGDVVMMLTDAASRIEFLEKKNDELNSQLRIVRIFEMALNAGTSQGYEHSTSFADRLRALADAVVADEKRAAAGAGVQTQTGGAT